MSDTIKKLYIEPSSRCNLNCVMCFRNSWFDEGFGDLPLDVYKDVLDDPAIESAHTVFFGGMGEPLLHKDILSMIALAKSKGKRVEMITNGTLLTEEMAGSIIEAGLDELWVSVDGLTSEYYDNIRTGSEFSLLWKNINKFNFLRQTIKEAEERYVDLGLTFVAMKSNLEELKNLPFFAMLLRAQHVNISNVLPTTPEMEDELLYERTVDAQANTSDRNNYSVNKLWNMPSISMPFFDLQSEQARDAFSAIMGSLCPVSLSGTALLRQRRYCKFVEEGNVFVRWDGDVSPCMALLHSSKTYLYGEERRILHHSFGNVKETSLGDIWNSAEFTAFRNRVLNFEFSPCVQCGGCQSRIENQDDCVGNCAPTCGACLWSEGILSCP